VAGLRVILLSDREVQPCGREEEAQTDVVKADTDIVLRLLRLLPPRERLRVVAEVLPELEDELPAATERAGFWQGLDIGTLAESQGVQPIGELEALFGGWPEDEPVDDFLAMLHRSRQENLAEARPA
jgi:hypothetical protein